MSNSDRAYPLHWPEAWPRTKQRAGSQFRTTLAGALGNVEGSLKLFAKDSNKKINGMVISSNVSLGHQNPSDPGVACYFTWDEIPTCIAVDRYAKVQENLQAIHHCIEAERTKLRHGGINLVRAGFRGFAALPPPDPNEEPWHQVLLVESDCDIATAQRSYKRLCQKTHPDKKGGSEAAFLRVQRAWGQASRACN